MRFLEKWKFSTKIPWKSVAHRGQIGQGLRSASRVGQYYGLQRVYSSWSTDSVQRQSELFGKVGIYADIYGYVYSKKWICTCEIQGWPEWNRIISKKCSGQGRALSSTTSSCFGVLQDKKSKATETAMARKRNIDIIWVVIFIIFILFCSLFVKQLIFSNLELNSAFFFLWIPVTSAKINNYQTRRPADSINCLLIDLEYVNCNLKPIWILQHGRKMFFTFRNVWDILTKVFISGSNDHPMQFFDLLIINDILSDMIKNVKC